MIDENYKIDSKFSKLVNFKKNLDIPFHRWFNIKEGYASDLVKFFIDNQKIKDGYVVDFFSGSGTTALTAKHHNLKYFGCEINPFLYLLSKVKLYDFDSSDIEKLVNLKKQIFNKSSGDNEELKLSISKKVFGNNYQTLLEFRTNILRIKNKKYRNFFIINLCSILEKIGSAKKDGNGLKYPKSKKINDLKESFDFQFQLMISDILSSKHQNILGSQIIKADSRNIPEENLKMIEGKTSLVIFSPPYANCFDYTEVYKLELWVSGLVKEYSNLKEIRNDSLSSHLNKTYVNSKSHELIVNEISQLSEKKLWSNKIIHMLNEYFFDMEKIINNSYRILKNNGCCVIVVGNSAYSGIVIQTDLILTKIAKNIGFKSCEIKIARKLRASSQQSKFLSFNNNNLRESILILKK